MLEVTEQGFGDGSRRRLASWRDALGCGAWRLTLEGGYDLAALRASASATVAGLLRGLSA